MSDFVAEDEDASRLDAIDAVLAQMANGESAAAIRRGLVPEVWAPVLSRVAVAGRFDQVIYDRMLGTASPADPPALSILADVGLITPVPGRSGWFVMPQQDREIWAAALLAPELAALETELAQAHLNRGDQMEGMQHLLNGEPARGRELLESLLSEADAQLNLPRCQDILRAAEHSKSSTGADLAELIASHTAYLNARSMWLTDYYQSAHFLAPPRFVRRGRMFTAARDTRVWHIIGQGGTGKTMQLRWLVSRLWVPQPSRTPCARVDFDTVDPMACARYPFLVFIMLADQLAGQLPHNPFSRLLRSYQPFLRFAMRGTGTEIAPSAEQAARARQEVPRLFADSCRAVGDTPIVIILDTLEELSLRYPGETAALVGQFSEVYRVVPELRLVFAGRYKIPEVCRLFNGVRPRLATPFSLGQSNTYLERIRGITDADRRADLIKRAGSLPYVLAMYADLVTADPAVPLDEISHELEPRLVYLAERIIDRIPEPLVRWLLRYGWVPRRLTRGYVRDVLAPFVIRASSGDRMHDDPMLDPITEWRGRRLFPTDLPDLRAELDRAWDDLQAYVSDSSWVIGVPGDTDTIVLKAEMLAPMRAVLASRPILRQLHQRSADFYGDLARAHPSGRSRLLREQVFHLAQAGSPDLLVRWREYVDQARELGDYAALADLSAEVTGPEYVDEGGMPRQRGQEKIVPVQLVIEARLWRAYAAQAQIISRLQEGNVPGLQDDPLWADIRRELKAAAPLARPTLHAWAAMHPEERRMLLIRTERLVSAALALADGDPRRAWDMADELRDAEDDISMCAEKLQVAAAPLTGENVIPVLESLIQRAFDADRTRDAAASARTLAGHLVSAGDMERAVSVLRVVVGRTGLITDTYLSVLIEQGTPIEVTRSRSYAGLPPGLRLAVDWKQAKAYLALRRPERAMQLLLESEKRLDQLREPVAQLRERAFCLEMKGITYGTLLRLNEAAAAFEQSASLWLELGHPDGHLRSRRHHAEILLREAGDVTEALTLLAGLSVQLDGGEESAAVQRLTAEALGLNGSADRAVPIIERLVRKADSRSHRIRALAALAGLVATQDVDRFGPLLHDSLSHVRPQSARLQLLQELRWCPPLPAHPVLDALANQAAVTGQRMAHGDMAVYGLQQAYAARAFGSPDVRRQLRHALAEAQPGFLACEILRHFPDDAPDLALDQAEDYLRANQVEDETLAAMIHLRAAERRAHRQSLPDEVERLIDRAEVERLIDRAEVELETAGRPSRWMAECYELRGRIALDRFQRPQATRALQSAQILQRRLGNVVAVRSIETRLAAAQEQGGKFVRAATEEQGGKFVLAGAPPISASELVVRDLPGVGRLDTDLDGMQLALSLAHDDSQAPRSLDAVVKVESPELDVLRQPWEFVADRVYRTQPAAGSLKRDVAWLRWVLEERGRSLTPDLRAECLRVISGHELLDQRLREQVELTMERPDRRRRVIIIRSSEEAESSWRYGLKARGLDLLSSYLSAGWDADEFATAQPRQFGVRRLLAHRPTDVIHLSARMETSGTLSWFDTSEENLGVRSAAKAAGKDTGIFATDVIQWLAEMNRSFGSMAPPPVIILDPVDPPYSGSTGDILSGRNRFAASVYLDGMASAVVATGLVGRDPLASQQTWLNGVERGDSLEQMVHDLRRTAEPNMPPALFAPSRTFTIS